MEHEKININGSNIKVEDAFLFQVVGDMNFEKQNLDSRKADVGHHVGKVQEC